MTYTICEHKHKFAVWATGRAAKVPGLSLKVKQAGILIETAGLKGLDCNPDNLPGPGNDAIDRQHREWREVIKKEAKKLGVTFIRNKEELKFSDGLAAKLINIYLKSVFVCGGHDSNAKVERLHPPIDRELLKGLANCNKVENIQYWKGMAEKSWTSYNSADYENVIKEIRKLLGDRPLWEIEKYWPGYQS